MSSITTTQAPLIAVSEFFVSPTVPVGTSPSDPELSFVPSPVISKLRSVGPSRIRDMRAGGVSMQIVSHIPITTSPQTCSKLNDSLNAASCTSDRLAAMALLPEDAQEAARELQRCITKYKFVGGTLASSQRTDDAAYEALWSMAERYSVPIAIREAWPTREQAREYAGSLSDPMVGPLITNHYAAHTASPFPILRLYASGVLDRHPKLRLIVSQSGLMVASLLPRIESVLEALPKATKPTRSFLDVWQNNFFVSTEDVLDLAGMRALLEKVPMDRVLYASNYPFEEKGKGLMGELKESGIVGKEEWERIAWGNAEALFGLKGAAASGRAIVGRPWG